jgi:hypothetical protein
MTDFAPQAQYAGGRAVPLTKKGRTVMSSMVKTYGSKKKAKEVFYASQNKHTITGVTREKKG